MKLRKQNPNPIVTLAVPVFKKDLEEFREYCKTIDEDPRTIVYAFIKAVITGQLDVAPKSGGPFTQ